MTRQPRKQRSGVVDLWHKKRGEGRCEHEGKIPSQLHGKGSRWRALFVDGDDQERAKSFAMRSDAQSWLNERVSELVSGTYIDPDRSAVIFGEVAEKWFASKSSRGPKTVAGYRSLLDTQVLPQWAKVPLRDIEYEDVQDWITELSVSGKKSRDGSGRIVGGLSPSRVVHIYQVFHWVLQYAVKARRLSHNPADGIELPRRHASEKRYLTVDELMALEDAIEHFGVLVLVLGTTGIRYGEATALRVSDVDHIKRRLRISKAVTSVPGSRRAGVEALGRVLGPVKNHTSRTVPLTAFVAHRLKVYIATAGRGRDDLIFPSLHDPQAWLPLEQFRWIFDKAAAAIGQDGLTPHELRHTAASLAIQSGANVKVVQKMLGHKTATMTLDLYGHLFEDDLDGVASALDAALITVQNQSPTVIPFPNKGGAS